MAHSVLLFRDGGSGLTQCEFLKMKTKDTTNHVDVLSAREDMKVVPWFWKMIYIQTNKIKLTGEHIGGLFRPKIEQTTKAAVFYRLPLAAQS